jgi:hypothetical protein
MTSFLFLVINTQIKIIMVFRRKVDLIDKLYPFTMLERVMILQEIKKRWDIEGNVLNVRTLRKFQRYRYKNFDKIAQELYGNHN